MMKVRELLDALAGVPVDAEVQISFREDVLEEDGWHEYDTDADVFGAEYDAATNTVSIKEA